MRKRKTIKIDEAEITVMELRVKDYLETIESMDGKGDLNLSTITPIVKRLLPMACDIDPKAIIDMTPSEIEELFTAFKEVNASFFRMAQAMGLGEIIKGLKKTLLSEFAGIFADSLKQGT